jgi:hypothetical protein
MSQKKAQLLNPLGGNINVTGVITASSFSGDGTGLTGVASTDNIQTATQATFLGDVSISGVSTFADAINFSSANTKINAGSGINVVLQQSASDKIHFELATQSIRPNDAHTGEIGNATYPFKKVTALNLIATEGVNATGVVTAASGSFSGNVSIGGTLSYLDVTNIDSVGIITAQQGIQVLANGINVTGVVTATSFEGDGSALTGISPDKISEGNTEVETVDTGSDGHIKFTTEGSERARIDNVGTVRFGADADDVVFFGTTKIFRMGGTSGFQIQEAGSSASITQGTGALNFYYDSGNAYKWAVFNNAGSVDLYHANNKKFETTAHGAVITGVATATSFSGEIFGEGILKEQVTVTAGKLSDNTNINLENGMVHLFTTTETTTSTPNLRYNGSTSLNSKMAIGEAISVTLITTAAAGGYSAQLTIDGSAVTENWIGGSAPDAGGSSGVDIYAYTIIKTADATFTVIGSLSKTSA